MEKRITGRNVKIRFFSFLNTMGCGFFNVENKTAIGCGFILLLTMFSPGCMVLWTRKNMAKDPSATGSRLSIPLNDSGQIDLEHMRPSSAAKLIDLIKTDPVIQQAYAETKDTGDQPALFDGLTTENVAKGLDAICSINAMVFRVAAARFIKHPILRDQHNKPIPLIFDQDILDRGFGLTEKQHAELDPRAARLAEKYSSAMPEWLKKNLDLYMFVSMFLAYTAENARTVLGAQIARDLKRVQHNAASAAAARPHNPQPDSDVQAQPVNGRDQHPEQPFPPSGISVVETDQPEAPAA